MTREHLIRGRWVAVALCLVAGLGLARSAAAGRGRGPDAAIKAAANRASLRGRHRPVGHRLAQRSTGLKAKMSRLGETRDEAIAPATLMAHVAALETLGRRAGMTIEYLTPRDSAWPVIRIDIPSPNPQATRALINAGTHAEEVMQSIPQTLGFALWALRNKTFRDRFRTTIILKVNPSNPELDRQPWNVRRMTRGVDMNRSFAEGRWIPESRAIARSLGRDRFDVFIDVHADSDLPGFLLINESRGQNKTSWNIPGRALSAMRTELLLDARPDQPTFSGYLLERLGTGTADGPYYDGAFDTYVAQTLKVPHSFTLETPQNLRHDRQVRGGIKLIRSTLENVRKYGQRYEAAKL